MQNPIRKFWQSFWKNRFFVGKIKNLDELQLPKSWKFFAESLHTCPTYQRLQKIFFYFV